MNKIITYEDFQKVDIHLGTIIKAEVYEKLKKPSKIEAKFETLLMKQTKCW